MSEISTAATRNAKPARRNARPPAAGTVMPRLTRTWNSTTMAVLTSITTDTDHPGAMIRSTSHSGTAAVSTRYWIAITPSSNVRTM